MAPGGQLLIVEELYPARVNSSVECRRVAGNDVLMLVCTGGRQRSEEKFRTLLASSGFQLSKVVPTAAGISILHGEPV